MVRRPLLVAVVVVLVGEALVRGVAGRLPPPQRWSAPEADVKLRDMERLHREGRTGGVAVIGTSLTDVGIDPAQLAGELGLPVYDASLAGGTIETQWWWYDHVVVPLLRPRAVVFGITSRELNPNDPDAARLEKEFFAAPAVQAGGGTETFLERLDRYGSDVSALVRYRRELRRPVALVRHTTPIDNERRFVTPLGQETFFAPIRYAPSATIDEFFRRTVTAGFEVGAGKVAALDGLLADLERSTGRALLVAMPVTEHYVELHPRGAADYARYDATMGSAAGRAGVVELDPPRWAESFFADPIHLNAVGAHRLTPLVAAALAPLLARG